MAPPFNQFLKDVKRDTERAMVQKLDAIAQQGTQLIPAMRYSLLLGGKRIRPALVMASAHAVSGHFESTLDAACAIEAVHTYSLVHDDLPAMDDDDLRRGQASCHKAFDEATAILAGDALQCAGFEWLADSSELTAQQKITAIAVLAKASGSAGMVQGQSIDLSVMNQSLTLAQLETMHTLKTGALICASVLMGATAGNASQKELQALQTYAQCVGLAFQVQDDILDVIGDTQALGKQTGADAQRNKPTYVSILGLDAAQEKTQTLLLNALDAISDFDNNADYLRGLARLIVNRAS